MIFKATPEFAIAFTKFSTLVGTCWPNYKNAPKWKFVLFQIRWWLTFCLSVSAFLPMCYAAYNHWRNILSFTKSLFDAANTSQTFIKMILSKIHYKRLQYLLYEMENYVTNAREDERELFIVYIKRCGKLHLFVMIFGFMAILIIIVAPIGLPQPFPNIADYPFPVDESPAFELVYAHQSAATLHCLSIPVFDMQIALLLWYSGARLELLAREFKTVTDNKHFVECVKKHQYLLWYIQEIIISSRYILATTSVTCVIAVITSGVHIAGNEPVGFKIPFAGASSIIAIILYISAWPSEHLIHMCEGVGTALYESEWVQNSKALNNSMLIVMHRAQKPSTIEVIGVMPILSLPYYATFLSKTFSYFTTLRVLLSKVEMD
uniref:Odorant receptor n=1 Tax=Microplitis mediator TaxID=375433 RepID=A0A0H4K7H8_9HYME|nr:odorant receptor 25 [Microplitis mediator]